MLFVVHDKRLKMLHDLQDMEIHGIHQIFLQLHPRIQQRQVFITRDSEVIMFSPCVFVCLCVCVWLSMFVTMFVRTI